MARYKGTFRVAANYEPLVGGPFDARQLVETKADLIAPSTWQQPNGDLWIYEGMIVSVKEEHAMYILNNSVSYFLESSWTKLANYSEIEELNNKIGDVPQGRTIMDLILAIEGGGGVYDDTELKNRIESVETVQEQLNKDYETLKCLVGTTSVQEQINTAIDTLAPIARTGNINDLTQNENEYMVLSCGDSDELE